MKSVKVHSAALNNTDKLPVLKEGSSVYVRILNKTQNGKFIVSFNNQRILVDSKIDLKPGQSFLAKLQIVNNKINLIPVKENQNTQNLQKNNSFFQNIGLPQDNISVAIFNQLKSLNLKFDLKLFNKIRKIADKFSDKKEKVSSLMMLMEQKEIEISEETVNKIINCCENQQKKSKNPEKDFFRQNRKDFDIKEEFSKFFKGIFTSNSKNKNSVLGIFNQIGFNLKNNSYGANWIHIPFEFNYLICNQQKSGNGFINLFFKEKTLSSAILKFNFDKNEYKFLLNFKNRLCNSIKFFKNSDFNSDLLNKFTEFLKKQKFADKNFSVKFLDKDFYSDFETESFDFKNISEEA